MRTASLASALVLVGLVGCSGNSAGLVQASPFAGQWSGTYDANISQSGTAALSIGENGAVSGSGHNNTANFDFVIDGTVQNDGHLTGNVSGGTVGTLDGNLLIANSGHLTGTVRQMHGSATVTLQFDLSPQ